MANCMYQDKGLNLKYQVESLNFTNYIVNHTATKSLRDITPKGAWRNIKPAVSHFRVFGVKFP